MEILVPPDGGTPPHIHSREDEMFYILEGEFEVLAAGQVTRVGPGSLFHGPRHIPHFYRNVGAQLGRALVMARPAGFERFMEELGRRWRKRRCRRLPRRTCRDCWRWRRSMGFRFSRSRPGPAKTAAQRATV